MTFIDIHVKGAVAKATTDGALTAGMVGVPVSFTFDEAWDGLNCIAVFRADSVVKDRALIGTTSTVVPWEMLKKAGPELSIGVEGRNTDGTVVIPTIWAKCGVIRAGANAVADPGLAPSPTVYDDIMAAIANMGGGVTDEQIAAAVAEYMENNQVSQAAIGEVSLLADAWEGDASPYSQVVDIAGVTPNSQVDLTPSIEQLAVFHHKDLAFVTENEDGVVTVYAIGDKPLNDYTIQVTITEVYV